MFNGRGGKKKLYDQLMALEDENTCIITTEVLKCLIESNKQEQEFIKETQQELLQSNKDICTALNNIATAITESSKQTLEQNKTITEKIDELNQTMKNNINLKTNNEQNIQTQKKYNH